VDQDDKNTNEQHFSASNPTLNFFWRSKAKYRQLPLPFFIFIAGGYGDITVTAPADCHQLSVDNSNFQANLVISATDGVAENNLCSFFSSSKALSISGPDSCWNRI
jgi:hypothetical protein